MFLFIISATNVAYKDLYINVTRVWETSTSKRKPKYPESSFLERLRNKQNVKNVSVTAKDSTHYKLHRLNLLPLITAVFKTVKTVILQNQRQNSTQRAVLHTKTLRTVVRLFLTFSNKNKSVPLRKLCAHLSTKKVFSKLFFAQNKQ